MKSRTHLIYLAVFSLLLAGVSALQVSAKSNLTEAFNDLFMIVTIISIVVLLLVLVLWTYFIAKYREGTDSERKELDHSFSRRLEIGWTAVAILVIIFLMMFSYPYLFNTIDANEENVLEISGQDDTEKIIVEGTGSWTWRFHYENGRVAEPVEDELGVSYTRMLLTVDTPYTFVMYASGNLIHSFFVRELNFKQDVVPGTNNTFSVIIQEPGEYQIKCAEFCGPGHSEMRGTIVVVA